MKKRGQFYLMAAIIIIGIMVGLVTVYNKAETPEEDVSVYELSEEINYEANQVIDSGVFNSLPDADISRNIENLTNYYARSHPNLDMLIVYGNETHFTFVSYSNPETSNVNVSYQGAEITTSPETRPRLSSTIRVNLEGGTTNDFQLHPGRTFFVLLKKEEGGERTISTAPQ